MPPSGIRVMAHTPFTGKGAGFDDASEAIAAFTKAFNLANSERKKLKDDDAVLPVFIAPEWTFKKAEGFFGYGDMGAICEKLVALSKANADVLMVAGSVLWAIEGKEETGAEKKWSWSKFKFDKKFYYKEYAIVYNTAPVLMGGVPVHFYHKQFEGFDIDLKKMRAGDEVFAFDPGEGKGAAFFKTWKARCQSVDTGGKVVKDVLANTFEAADLLVGIEICADHNNRPLQKTGKKVDLELLVSCGAKLIANNMSIRKGGVAIGCDGNLKDAGVNLKAALSCFEIGEKVEVPAPSADKKSVYGAGVDGRVVIYDDVLKLA